MVQLLSSTGDEAGRTRLLSEGTIIAGKNKKAPTVIEALSLSNDSGIGKVTRLHLEALKQVLSEERVILITHPDIRVEAPPSWEIYRTPAKPLRLWRNLRFAQLLWQWRPDRVLCMGQTLPNVRPPAHYYMLVHDVGPLENLPFTTSKFDRANRRTFRKRIEMATSLWTVSEFTKNRIVELLPHKQHHISVINPFFADHGAHRPGDPLPQEMSHVSPYILSVGNIEPRKNYPALIRAFQKVCEVLPEPWHLVIIGHKAWGYDEVQSTLVSCPVRHRVHCLGYVPEQEKKQWLQGCTVYASASRYEGWGLPLYEALNTHKPATYHRDTSQDEFARGFALGWSDEPGKGLEDTLLTLCLSHLERKKLSRRLEQEFEKTTRRPMTEGFARMLGLMESKTEPVAVNTLSASA